VFDILQDSCSDPANDAGLTALAEARNEMKADRGGWRPLQRNELRDELVRDTYTSKKKLSEPHTLPGVRRGLHGCLGSIHPRFSPQSAEDIQITTT
jgi:hypothetical protein